jgi:hypothetical protein
MSPHQELGMPRSSHLAALILVLFCPALLAHADSGRQHSSPAQELVQRVVANELNGQSADHSHWMFRMQHEESGNSVVKEVIETANGNLERVVERNGKPLDAAEQKEEDRRIQALVRDPDALRKKEQERKHDAQQAQSLLKILPHAMLFTEQGRQGDIVRLSFRPNSNYDPPTREAMVFHHMEGTMWVNARQLRLVRIDGKLMDEVKFWGGLLGHLDKGGSFSVHDSELAPGVWDTTYLNVNMHGKAVFFHTIAVTEREIHSDYRRVPEHLTPTQAADMLEKQDLTLARAGK